MIVTASTSVPERSLEDGCGDVTITMSLGQ
jgi:hypothetical protein